MTRVFTMAVGLLLLSAAVQGQPVRHTLREGGNQATMDYTYQYVEIKASGTSNPQLAGSQANKYIEALTTARRNAYTWMAATLGKIRATGETWMENERIRDTRFNAQFEQFVKGAREVEEPEMETMSDGSLLCRVTMGVYLSRQKGLTRLFIPRLKERLRADPPQQYELPEGYTPPMAGETGPGEPAPRKYTGLAIDGRGLGVQPAQAPRILAENGREVYGAFRADEGYAITQGVVGYAKSLDHPASIRGRTGDQPLVVRARRASGTLSADVVVSDEDAGRILYYDQLGNFLPECRVVFLVD